ncbi:glutathione binding-like protein, partial [Acinetobacter baumannii]
DRPFLAGDDYSIADIATFGWTHIANICGFRFDRHAYLCRWHERIAERPAVQRGITLPASATRP